MLTLAYEKRLEKNSLDNIRAKGALPAVFYGRLEKSTPVSVSLAEFKKVFKKAGESTVIELKGDDAHEALIHEVQFNAVTNEPLHVDFYVIEKGKKVEVDVPLEFVGVSPAVKNFGGILLKILHELPISALPKDLPHTIEVDISSLSEIGSTITVKDLQLPPGVTADAEGEEVVASIAEAKEEVVAEAPAVDLTAIEVEKKGKKDEEGAASTEAASEAKE